MTDTSGRTSPTPFAFYDPDGSCWRTSQGTFPWDSTSYSGTWPRWGSMRDGVAFALPTPAPLTAVSASSSLLPTPVANDDHKTPEAHIAAKADGIERSRITSLDVLVRNNLSPKLLPTPTAWLGSRDAHSKGDPERWMNPERSNELSDFVGWIGETTNQPSDDGNTSPGAPLPLLPMTEAG